MKRRGRPAWIDDLVLTDLALHGHSTINDIAKRTLEDGNTAHYALARNYQQVRLSLQRLHGEGKVHRTDTCPYLWTRVELPIDLRDFELDLRSQHGADE